MGECPQNTQVDVLHDRQPTQRIEAGAVHPHAPHEGQDPGVIPRVDVRQERPQLHIRDPVVAGYVHLPPPRLGHVPIDDIPARL